MKENFSKKIENFLFKKIELWFLLFIIILFIIFSLAVAVLVRQGIEGKTKVGSFSIKPLTEPLVNFSRLPEKILKKTLKPNDLLIEDLWDEERKFSRNNRGFYGEGEKNKYILLSRYSVKDQQSIIELVNLENFNSIHKWVPNMDKFNSLIDDKSEKFENLERDHNNKRFRIFHPIMTDDGGIIFSDNYTQLIKIDHCSNLVWQNTDYLFHHTKEIDLEGNYWIPADQFSSDIKNFENFRMHNTLVKVNKDGKILFSKSLVELFIENNLEYHLHNQKFSSDIFHLNDIEPTKIKSNFWKIGDLFISLRDLSMIVQYRPSTNEIINIIHGPFFNQHDVDVINDEEISIFNNNRRIYGLENAEIIIYNFRTKKFRKHLETQLKEKNIKTTYEGLHTILPNFQTYVESNQDGIILSFDENEKEKWRFTNDDNEKQKLYAINWSRIMFDTQQLKKVSKLEEIKLSKKCIN